jgi:RNA exonuclease 4
MVAEVAVVNWDGEVVYHTFVEPTGSVVDYRTSISGITPEKLVGATPLWRVQEDLVNLLDGKILVGHALENDLRGLGLRVDPAFVRNTAHHPFFKTMASRGQLQPRKLANLHMLYVGTPIQQGVHGAVEDAKASMALYRTRHANWNMPVAHEGPMLGRPI